MFYRINGPLCKTFLINEFVYYEFDKPFHAIVRSIENNTAVLEIVKDHQLPKHNVWGINARNREQNFALNLLLDPDIDFVSLLGQAGTGKTLLTLAAALTQVLDSKRYSEIIMTRVTAVSYTHLDVYKRQAISSRVQMCAWLGKIYAKAKKC